jgi:hypothetical protein
VQNPRRGLFRPWLGATNAIQRLPNLKPAIALNLRPVLPYSTLHLVNRLQQNLGAVVDRIRACVYRAPKTSY